VNRLDSGLYHEIRDFIVRRARSGPDGEDLCQTVFERVLPKLAGVDPSNVRAYCFAAARHALADYYRNRSDPTVQFFADRDAVDAASDPSKAADQRAREVRSRIHRWVPDRIDSLPATYREPLKLFVLEGRNAADIAESLGLSVSAVKVRLHRGRRMVLRNIDACCRLLRDARGQVFDYEERRPDESCPAGCA